MRKRWILFILAVLGAFFIAGVAGALTTRMLGFWYLPGSGFSAALVVVLTAYVAAPSRKFPSSCITFLIGAAVAWLVLEPSYFPESYVRAYQPTHLPVAATYLGGMFGLIASGMLSLQSRLAGRVGPMQMRDSDK